MGVGVSAVQNYSLFFLCKCVIESVALNDNKATHHRIKFQFVYYSSFWCTFEGGRIQLWCFCVTFVWQTTSNFLHLIGGYGKIHAALMFGNVIFSTWCSNYFIGSIRFQWMKWTNTDAKWNRNCTMGFIELNKHWIPVNKIK